MKMENSLTEPDTAGETNAIEAESGQCTVIQCHHDKGRIFIRSIRGEGEDSVCRVTYRGQPVLVTNGSSAAAVGFSFLDDGWYERLQVREYLLFWAEVYECQADIDERLNAIGLLGKAHERIAKLSYSEKRLLGFARSVLHDPQLVIWEDPEQNLDLESCMRVRKMIAELLHKDKAVLLTCSTMEQALSLSNRIFHLTGSGLTPVVVQEQAELNEPDNGADDIEEDDRAKSGYWPDTAKLAKLMVKTQDKYVFLDPREMTYIESSEGVTLLYMKDGSLACAWTLSELEEKLKPFRFYRCHRSYLVNLDAVSELIVWSRNSYSLVLSDDKKSRIPLSKGKFEELKTIVSL